MQDQAQIKVRRLLPHAFVALAVVLFAASDVSVGIAPVYKNSKVPIEQRVEDLLARLTRKEKVSLMGGGSPFTTQPIERLGVPALHFSDGPNGVHSREEEPTTVFPTGSALAASWNPDVVQSVGQAIGREALARDVQVILGPNVNMQRSPLAGRNFESYSEDPYLAGKIGIDFVKGVQSQGVGTSVKHFVANEQEANRLRGSSNVDERTLREIYLLPFEMIVKEAKPWTVMVSYNRLNGTYMSENEPLMRNVLKEEWGYDGLLMSDWGAVHTTVEAANAGLDLEMPGPPRYFGSSLVVATLTWQVEQSVIDDAARRVLRLIVRSGVLDGGTHGSGELRSARNRAVAFAAAREAITLLKNDRQLLPLDKSRIRSLAVIGPNADVPLYQGGGSAQVIPSRISTPLSSLRNALGTSVKITYAQGADNDRLPPPADARLLSPTQDRTEQGLAFAYFDNTSFQGRPVRTGVETYFDKGATRSADGKQISARWEGYFWPPRDGAYELCLSQLGAATLYIDDRKLIAPDLGTVQPPERDYGLPVRTASVELQGGRPHRLKVEYVSLPITVRSIRIGIRVPAGGIYEAVQVARSADAAIVFVGSSRSGETEGRDRPDMDLTGRQNELVDAVLAANPNTIVVLNSGSPIALPWVDKAPSIVEAWLAGEEGPEALVQVLLGEADPSGKLPFTFPRRLEDNPAYLYYSPGRDANYGEGVFVGYRYYDKRKIDPLFAFGHGLSYTTFDYGNLRVPAEVPVGKPIDVSIDVKNTGKRSGQETVQLYVGDEATTEVVRPVKELKAFQKVSLAPGETRTVKFALSPRDLSYYDVHRRDWTSTPGLHRIYVGSSSKDIRQMRDFRSTAPQDPRTTPASAVHGQAVRQQQDLGL
jgi:beta-glucosidase